jgi:hypothetical protein
MAVGLILAQGLSYAIQQMFTAGLLVSGDDQSLWSSLGGILFLHGIQGLSLLVGGAICGAGKQRGVLFGSFVGLMNGLIFLIVQSKSGEVLSEIAVYGQPLLHMALGALGGLIGTMIWKPIAPLRVPEAEGDAKTISVPAPTLVFLAGQVHLGRVFIGVGVVVFGVVWSQAILNWVLNAAGGALEIKTHLQAQLIGWEVSALVTLVGAAFAGASTFNGLKQGLCVGVASSLILAGVQLGNPTATLKTTGLMIGAILILSLGGGWFGGTLFPPVQQAKRRKRILDV